MWASGSHVWNGNTGSLTANAMNSKPNITPAGSSSVADWSSAGRRVISNVPAEKNTARIPTSMNALPRNVKIKNFIAEYSRRPLPQIAMRKNMGTISNSHMMKKRIRS